MEVGANVDFVTPPFINDLGYVQWLQIDCLVLSWIQFTISHDILRSIITPHKPLTAQNAWLKIEKLFRDHVESHIVSLRQEFYHLEKIDFIHECFS